MMDLPNFVGALLGNQSLFSLKIDGIEAARVVRFSGHEGISSLYEFHIEIAGPPIALGDALGKSACLTIDGVDAPRRVHGIVSHIEYSGRSRRHHLYELTLVPPLWRLLHRHDCRVFQPATTQQILAEVFKGAGLDAKSIRFDLQAAYEPRNYCVQYRESDFNFVSRLMEEDGIFYFFEHQEESATLVITDHPGAHPSIVGNPAISFSEGEGVRSREHVTALRVSESVRPGKVSLRDYNFHEPDEKMEVSIAAEHELDLEVYDYPGEYQKPTEGAPHHGKSMAQIRLDALRANRRQVSGGSDCMRLTPGHTCILEGHPLGELNGDVLLVRVIHHGSQPQVLDEDGQGAFHYGNDFTCIAKETPFRPPRITPRPVVRGVQSATVVGPGTEEVHTDAQGRVRVQFHWDRQGKMDERSSCWVRVSQLWAGSGWGAMFIPRVGHEVLVDFIEGDPDRPIVTGRVYHGKNDVPYPLPDEKTKSTIKSNSSLGGDGFNEFRFEDRKGAEEVFLHAQRDLNEVVLNDNSRNVTANQSFSVGGNQSFTITKNRSVTVTEGDESLTVSQGKSTTTVKMNRDVTVQSGDSSLTVETGSRTVTVKQAISETSTDANIDLTAKTSMSLTAETKTLAMTAMTDVSMESQTATLSAMALQDVAIASKAATLSATALQSVSVASIASTLSLFSQQPASLASMTEVVVSAPTGVHVSGGTVVGIGASKIVLTGDEEITLQVGGSAITLKKDGITMSAPKITSTAVAVHEISGALVKIN